MKHASIIALCAILASCAPIQQARAIGLATLASASGKLNTTNPVVFSPDGRYVAAVDEVGDCYSITVNDTTTNIRAASDCVPKSLQLIRYSDDGMHILASGPGWGITYSSDNLQVVGVPVDGPNYAGRYATVSTGSTWINSRETYDAMTGIKIPGAVQQAGLPLLVFVQAGQTYIARQDDATVRLYPQQSAVPAYSMPGDFVGFLDGTLLVRQGRKLIVQKPFTNETVNVFELDATDHVNDYLFSGELYKQKSAMMSADLFVYLQSADDATKIMFLDLKTGESILLTTVDSASCVVPDRAHQRVALCDSGQLVSLPAAK